MSDSASTINDSHNPTGALRTDDPDRTGAYQGILAGSGLFVLMLSLQPFAGVPEQTAPGESTGNIVNQVGWFGLGLVFLAAMLGLARRDVLARLGFGRWAVVFGIAALSIAQSLDPTASLRGLLLTAIVMIVVAGVLVLPATSAASPSRRSMPASSCCCWSMPCSSWRRIWSSTVRRARKACMPATGAAISRTRTSPPRSSRSWR